MVSIVFIIGVLNLMLGFALAVALDHLHRPEPPAAQPDSAPPPEHDTGEPAPLDVAPVHEEDVKEQIPSRWLELLEREGLVANSFVEAVALILKLEIGRYREALVLIEDRARRWNNDRNVETLDQICLDFKRVNKDWNAEQAEVAELLNERCGQLGAYDRIGDKIRCVLEQLQVAIRRSIRQIEELQLDADPGTNYRCLADHLADLIDLAHLLRDEVNESLIGIILHEDRLGEIDADLQFDPLTGLVSRQGIEVVFADWWRDDATRTRMASAAMMDIDLFRQLNRDAGTRFGDQMISAFGSLLAELDSTSGGPDRVCRFAGQRFVFFFGNSGPRQALATMERVRQSVEQSIIEHGDRQLSITVSAAVVEVIEDEKTSAMFERLVEALEVAKNSGRNQTSLDEGHGPSVVSAPQFQVHGRVIRMLGGREES